MKISYQWLAGYVPVSQSAQELAALITSSGLEVEAVELHESVRGGLQGLVIGEVLEKAKHPDADRLSITQVKVDAAGTVLQIVCGAANVAAGQKVIVALPGTTLYPTNGESFVIKKSKIRGAESNGMICAEDEIGLGTGHDGIIVLDSSVTVGTSAAVHYNISQDHILHIGLTPNRIDAASHIGVARDVAALYSVRNKKNTVVTFPEVKKITASGNCPVKIEIADNNLCRRYAGVVIENATVGASPAWLQQKLEAVGIRSINSVVDITNYVMLECGQPLHAFDADKISGNKIIVKTATAGNTFVTLDDIERKLSGTELMICNTTEPMCIAGVFGGSTSGITNSTKRIFIESAWFNSTSVRKTARAHGLHTDASFRFERGTDAEMVIWALQRAAGLLEEITGGKIQGDISDVYPQPFKKTEVVFSPAKFLAFTGHEIAEPVIETILSKLDISIASRSNNEWKLEIPLYRVDVTRAADVYEEILRIYGYDNIPFAPKLNASLSFISKPDHEKWTQAVCDFLSARGFTEILNNSLTSAAWNEKTGAEKDQVVSLLNPLSQELDTMRTSLLPGGLTSIAYNQNRQQTDLRFFECGKTYVKTEKGFLEKEILAIWITGNKHAENWIEKPAVNTLYTLFAVTESLLDKYAGKNSYQRVPATQTGFLHAFNWTVRKKNLVTGGEVSDALLDAAGIDNPVFYAEIDWAVLMEIAGTAQLAYKEISKFPLVRRDLSLLLDENITYENIRSLVKKTDPVLIKNVFLFDHYQGNNLPQGKKSYAIGLHLQHDERTLTDADVDKLIEKVLQQLTQHTGAVLR